MNEIKTDLFPNRLRAAREREEKEAKVRDTNSESFSEPLLESSKPGKDGEEGE